MSYDQLRVAVKEAWEQVGEAELNALLNSMPTRMAAVIAANVFMTRENRIYYNKVPPHLYFSKTEMAVWRNFTSWNLDGDIAYLPGPAEWYPDNYDTTQHGFHVDLDAGRAYEAWEMLAEETEPTNFKWVLPSDDTLVLLPPTKESEEFLSQFYEM
ncbi:hypothetical protein VC83_05803 [Pseudogymnoascus destructans]|uniref:Uncharacterized protein n=1 Tax=Pseudogymnoascus destructans TaxID=655981 RepID=A0A177A483_9PEZI|nr:uncharacterized protein VC83_05803 [Pseudogymnoascus destructans]OAF56978.1 hypothetical protein VC83_05803 [Pseudogymnoascus destructans]